MDKQLRKIQQRWGQQDKRLAALILCATAASSFAAHGFLFTNEFFSHDSVSYFAYATGTPAFYTSIGRFVIPVYEQIKGDVAAPWLIGLLFIFWMSLAAWLVTKLLKIRTNSGVVLTCGLLCTHQALTLTGATYVYCMDEYALALLAAVAAVWLFEKGWRWTLPGLCLLVVSLAIYQSYFTVAAALCMLMVMRRLAANERLSAAVLRGVRYLALLAAGFGAYYCIWTLICSATGVAKRRVEESLLADGGLAKLPVLLKDANVEYFKELFRSSGVLGWLMPAVNGLVLAVLVWKLVCILREKELASGNKVVLVVLACLVPTALNSAYILMLGFDTQLMTFAHVLLYVAFAACREPAKPGRTGGGYRRIAAVLLCCVLWQSVVFANQVYMKKDLEKNATISLATRIVDRVELLEGYVPGETSVAFVGRLDHNKYLNRDRDEFLELDATVGLWSEYAATYNLGRYLTDYLNYPLLWDTTTDFSAHPEVQAMPVFPAAEAIRMIDGTVVVKLS